MSPSRNHVVLYKDVSYPQLRSFCETARLGSMAAAARSLQLSHATVWKQIRALEKQLGQTLLETHGRQSGLTEAGQLLAKLASVVVAEFETLPERFQEGCGAMPARLSLAAPSRSCTEDLTGVFDEFRRRRPDVHLTIREAFEHQGDELLESGVVDVVIGDRHYCQKLRDLVVEPVYEIEPMVIMPVGHPLSRRRKIQLVDLAKYPVLNSSDNYPDSESCALLLKAGVFDRPDRHFDLELATSIRRCVKLGYGIGLVGHAAGNEPDPDLCQRSLKHCLRPIALYAYSFRRITENPAQTAFIRLVKEMLGS